MKRKYTVLLLIFVFILPICMCGCKSTSKVEVADPGIIEIPVIPEDYFYLAGEQVFFNYSSSDFGRAYFPLISSAPLSEKDITIEIAGKTINKTQYMFNHYGLEERFEMPFYAYQIFRGKDWKEECQLQKNYKEAQWIMEKDFKKMDLFQQATTTLEASQKEFLDDYEALRKQNKLPVLYCYSLSITMPKDDELSGIPITEITLGVNGRKQTFPVGEIKYTSEKDSCDLSLNSLITSRFNAGWIIASSTENGFFVKIDNRGNLILHNLGTHHFKAEEDLTVTAIELWDDSRQLSAIQPVISIPNEGGRSYDAEGKEIHTIVADYIWDGETPIFLEEGQELSIDFVLHDPRLSNAVCGFTQFKIAVYYENSNKEQGVTQQTYPIQIQTISGNPFEIYLQYELGIDTMSYYVDYYDVLNTEEYGGITIIDSISGG